MTHLSLSHILPLRRKSAIPERHCTKRGAGQRDVELDWNFVHIKKEKVILPPPGQFLLISELH